MSSTKLVIKKATKKKTMAKGRNNANRNGAGSMKGLALLRELMRGRLFLSFDFFRRYWFYVVMVTIMALAYISLKYDTQNKMSELRRLKVELNNAKTDCVDASARYNSKIRESQMTQMLDTMHIDLAAPEQPPYKLYDN